MKKPFRVVRLLIAAVALVSPPMVLADATTAPATSPAAAVQVSAAAAFAIGDPAPAISVTDLQGHAVTLDQYHGTPVVLQFGSLTDPIFRMHAPAVEALATQYGTKAVFLIVYQHEAHPAGAGDDLEINVNEGFSIAAPASLEERTKLAAQTATRLKIAQQTVLVDAWNDTTSRRYGGLANMTFLIDANGKIAAAYPWMDSRKLEGALDDVLASKPVSEAHRGPVRSSGAAILVAEDSDALGPSRFATIIDNLHLDDKQKAAIYPFLADYVAEIRDLRGGGAGAKAKAAAATTTTAAATTTTTAAAATAVAPTTRLSPAELFIKVRDLTQTFEAHVKPLLTDAQYAQLIEGVNRSPRGRRQQ